MFKSLQARLTMSYVVIVVICLVLVGLAAWVLLRGYQRNLMYSRLADRSILASRLIGESLRRGVTGQTAVERLAQQMNRREGATAVLVLLDPTGRVVATSDGRLAGQRFEDLALRLSPPVSWPIRGERRLAAGDRLLYVAEPVHSAGDEGQLQATHALAVGELYRPIRLALGDLLPRLLWAGAIALAVSIIVAAMTAYSVARPLDRIGKAAEEVASGNYDQQLNISSPAEVARLAHSFDVMARRVQATLQSQQDLVANVSHELKTPLTSIQGFSQALLDGAVADEASRQRAATIIHEEAGRMRRLVDDLLELARLEAGQITLAREPLDVAELLRAAAARFDLRLEQVGVELEVDVTAPLSPVVGDVDRLGQVFGNLIDNALKHARTAPGGGRVMLWAEQQDHLLICSVTDNGAGIPAQDLPRIFERFYQVDKSRARSDSTARARRRGVGLGLAIAQEIVEAHGGSIRAESVEGLGTRFTVELPIWQG